MRWPDQVQNPLSYTIVEGTKEHLVAIIEFGFISILSRRLERLVSQAVSA